MKGLTLSVQGAANYSHVPSYSFTSSLAKPGQISGMENASRMNLFWQNTNNVTYNTSFGDHHLTATAVFEASGAEGRNLKLTGSDLANDLLVIGMQKMQRHAMERMAIPQKLLCRDLVELCTITKGSIC